MGQGHRFIIDEDADQELDRRGEIVEQTDCGEGHFLDRRCEKQQRDGSDQRAADQQQVDRPVVAEMLAGSRIGHAEGQPDQQEGEGEKQQPGFCGQSGYRANVGNLADQCIAAPRTRQGQADPERVERLHGQHRNARSRNRNGDPFAPGKGFAEKHPAHQDGKQRADKIAETGGQDMVFVHRPDVDQPVGRDQAGTGQHRPAQFPIHHGRTEAGEIFPEIEDDQQQRHRPDDAMRDDLERGNLLQQLEIDRHQPPGDTGDQRLDESDSAAG